MAKRKLKYVRLRIKASLLDELSSEEMGALIRASAGKNPRKEDRASIDKLIELGLVGKNYLELFGVGAQPGGSNNSSIVVDPSQARDHHSPAVSGDSVPSGQSPSLSERPLSKDFSYSGRVSRIQYKAKDPDPQIPDTKEKPIKGSALRRSPGGELRPAHSLRQLRANWVPKVKRFSLDRPDTYSVRWMAFCQELQWVHRWANVDAIISQLQKRMLERIHYEGEEPEKFLGAMWYKEQETEAGRMVDEHYDKTPDYWREVVDWFFDHDFWHDKILNTKTLRRNYPRFIMDHAGQKELKKRVARVRVIGK